VFDTAEFLGVKIMETSWTLGLVSGDPMTHSGTVVYQ
jgi:hypothetical protein